jgi:uncharacterized protein (UPF0261 family)
MALPPNTTRVALTVGPTTVSAADFARKCLEAAGCVVTQFVADGKGGRELEAAIRAGAFHAVFDLTLTEVAADVIRAVGSAGPDRLTAAAITGIPQVIVLGGLDGVGDPPRRTTAQECDRVGLDIAQKACACRGPVAILFPTGGLSSLDIPGGPLYDPEANAALFQSLRNWLYGVEAVEIDATVSDPAVAEVAVATLLRLMNVTGMSHSGVDG